MRSFCWKKVWWLLLALLAASGLWLINLEITYQRNVRNMPADFHLRRHVITRAWRI